MFCGNCGTRVMAAVAVLVGVGQIAQPPATVYPTVTPEHMSEQYPRKVNTRFWLWVSGGVSVLLIAVGIIAGIRGIPPGQPCPSPCPEPPLLSPPFQAEHIYRGALGWSLAYRGRDFPVVREGNAIGWRADLDQAQWPYTFVGQPAAGRNARQIVEQTRRERFPDAGGGYEIVKAELGYRRGYGYVYDNSRAGGTAERTRVIIIAAVKNGVAVVMFAEGPYAETLKGHPNPSHTELIINFDEVVNTVSWRGDKPL